jgi:hypothetical protein
LSDSRDDGSLSGAITRDLRRYYAVVRDELAALRLTRDEACAICDALNGTHLDEHMPRFLWAEVEDADRLNGLGAKWEIDALALAVRLRSLSPGACMAIVDAVERFWAHADLPTDEALRRAGFTWS